MYNSHGGEQPASWRPFGRACAIAAGLAFALLLARARGQSPDVDPDATQAAHRDTEQAARPRMGRDFRGFGPPQFAGNFEWPRQATAKQGFVFLNGEYLAPPYEIESTDAGLTINGQKLTFQPRALFAGRGFGPPRSGEQVSRRLVGELESQLSQGCVVLSFEQQPLVVLDGGASAYDLLKSLTTTEGRSLRLVSLAAHLPPGFDQKVWDEWVLRFEPKGDFRQRAASMIAHYDAAESDAQGQVALVRWTSALVYPLNLGGMVMTVLAIGHLLGGRPHAGRSTLGVDPSPEMIRALNCSLFFIVTLSAFDLVWTILAAQSGQMQELNPLGSRLIDDPRNLAGFKMGITLPAIGLLWLLRQHKRAQVAAWWACLILTIVMFRWLTFNSMFVTA